MNENLQKPLMLIVDDVEINRVILAQFFKDDYEICEASNGEEALLFVEDHPVSVILLDLVMLCQMSLDVAMLRLRAIFLA